MAYSSQIDLDHPPGSAGRPFYEYAPQDISSAPVVTIITPFHDTGSIFHETAKSVLGQSFQQWEWIIVNDGSSDQEALAVLDHYRGVDPRIRIIDLPDLRGSGAAKNLAVKHARTDFIVGVDPTDLLEPTAVEKLFWFLISHPQYAFARGYSVEPGSQTHSWRSVSNDPRDCLFESPPYAGGIIRRAAFLEVGGFDENNRDDPEDWDFWLKCADKGYKGALIPEYLIWRRQRRNRNDARKDWRRESHCRYSANQLRRKYPVSGIKGLSGAQYCHPEPHNWVSDDLPATNILRSSKNRLLMIVPWLEMGGADKFNLDLLRELTRRHDYEVTIVTTLIGNNTWRREFSKYTPDIFIPDQFLHISDYPRFIRYLIRSRQIMTVFISHSEFAYLILPYLRSHLPDVSFVDYLHIDMGGWRNIGYPRLSLVNQAYLNLTIVASQHLKNWMVKRGANEKKIEVCTINIDPEEWDPGRYDRSALRRAMGIGERQPVILYAGRLVEQKQPMLAARVFLDLKRLNVSFVALIAGDGPFFSMLSSFFARRQITEVKMLGAVSSERMRELLAISDVFFLPSLHEGISLAIYEAMAMGVTPVAANVGGQGELVTPECGVLVRRGPSEQADYVQALRFLLHNPERCRAMGRRARERICAHFRLEQMSARMVDLFNSAYQRREMTAAPPVSVSFGRAMAARAVEMMRWQLFVDALRIGQERVQHNPSLLYRLKRIVSRVYYYVAYANPDVALFIQAAARRVMRSWLAKRLIGMAAAKLLQ